MSKEIIKGRSSDISGFYYDYQKQNPMMKVTLHANTKPPQNPYDKWVGWSENSGSPDFPYWHETILEEDEPNTQPPKITGENFPSDPRYGKRPICTSIVAEDFNVSIANSWADFSGGQQMQDAFNSMMKPMEPYSYEIGNIMNKAQKGLNQYLIDKGDNDFFGKSFLEGVSGYLGKGSNAQMKAGNVLSRSLVVQGTRFKYYSGTGIAFSNLGMKFTLFADYIEQFEYTKKGSKSLGYVFLTPDDQLVPLLPYAIGKYQPLIGDSDKGMDSWIESIGLDKYVKDSSNGIKDIANKFLGWQLPPGGFKADIQYIDSVQSGTLMLKIGPYYRLKNLLIQDIQLNYSKHIAKYYDRETGKLKTCPLYCDVFITLVPANKYSDQMLKEFITRRGTTYEKSAELSSITNLESTINSNLGL